MQATTTQTAQEDTDRADAERAIISGIIKGLEARVMYAEARIERYADLTTRVSHARLSEGKRARNLRRLSVAHRLLEATKRTLDDCHVRLAELAR